MRGDLNEGRFEEEEIWRRGIGFKNDSVKINPNPSLALLSRTFPPLHNQPITLPMIAALVKLTILTAIAFACGFSIGQKKLDYCESFVRSRNLRKFLNDSYQASEICRD